MTRSIAEPARTGRGSWARREARSVPTRVREAAVEVALLAILVSVVVALWLSPSVFSSLASLVAGGSSFLVALGAGLVVVAVAGVALGGPEHRRR